MISKMKKQKNNRLKFTAFLIVGIAIGATIGFAIGYWGGIGQQTIYEKLEDIGADYTLAQWSPGLLHSRTTIHQFREFEEIVQLAQMNEQLDIPLEFNLDKTYNILWRTNPEDEGWISIYFYTDPD